MATLVKRIYDEIVERTENCTKECTITMKYDGANITISPCLIDRNGSGLENVEFWLVYGPHPWVSNSKIEKVVEYLASYKEYCEKDEQEKKDCQAYYDKYFAGKSWDQIRKEQETLNNIIDSRLAQGITGNDLYKDLPDVGDWSWYSDWHKDLYGYRPR